MEDGRPTSDMVCNGIGRPFLPYGRISAGCAHDSQQAFRSFGRVPVGCVQAPMDHRGVLFRGEHVFFLSPSRHSSCLYSKNHARVSLVVIHVRVREKMKKDLTFSSFFCFFHTRRGTGSSVNGETVRSAGSECPRKRTPREHAETPRHEKRQVMRVIRRTRQCHVTCPKKLNSLTLYDFCSGIIRSYRVHDDRTVPAARYSALSFNVAQGLLVPDCPL